MNLKRIKNGNSQVLSLSDGSMVLISYSTPVAAFIEQRGKWYRTAKRHSVTTSKHINQWLKSENVLDLATEQPQEFFDNLLKWG